MDVEISDSKLISGLVTIRRESSHKDRIGVKKTTLQAVLEQCQRPLELLSTAECDEDEDEDGDCRDSQISMTSGLSSLRADQEVNQFCDLLKFRIEYPDFLEKLETAQLSATHNVSEEVNSWDLISDNDLWETEGGDPEDKNYVLVRQEDIVEGVASFIAAYLLSLKQTKDLTPNHLQEALSKTFSVKKKKGKLRKVWDGSKVIYNVASWGATAIGIYQNPLIVRAATEAFRTSLQVISKLL